MMAAQANVFRPFAQADSSVARKYGGTGLGLGLYLASRPGHGSTFTVAVPAPLPALPAWLERAPPVAPRVSQARAPDPFVQRFAGHVLLAEDGPDNQVLVCAFLDAMGLTWELVQDGAAAVQAALAGNFDVVLMAIQMPVLDGVRATGVLRRAGYARPIVALTANVMPEDLARYARAGCNGTVGKPIEVAHFVQTVARMLGKAGGLDAPMSFEELDGYQAIRASFEAGLAARLQELADNIAQERWHAVVTLAHQLKGAAGAFGFPGVTQAAAQVQVAAAQSDRPGARRAFAHLMALDELEQANLAGACTWQA